MRFFPHAVKQPLLPRTESKSERKEKRKIECLSNGQISKNSVHIGLKIIFIVGQRKVSTGSNKLLLAYLHKRRQTK